MKTDKTRRAQVDVDTSVYPLEAVQSACYRFIDRAYLRVERPDKDGARARVVMKGKAPETDLDALRDEFHNELLHQTLRLRVSANNQKIREFIVTKALVSAQPAAAAAEAAADCPECRRDAPGAPQAGCAPAPAPAVDAELEAEIDKLLAEIEKGGEEKDPLDVVVPWEDKHAEGKKQ